MQLELSNKMLGACPVEGRALPLEDKRPRAAIILGDGFSKAMLKYLRLDSAVSTTPFPCPSHYQYLPSLEDRFLKGQLWTSEKFPQLFEWMAQNASGHSQDDLLRRLSLHSVASGNSNTIAVDGPCIARELRAYLWLFFKQVDRLLRASNIQVNPNHWEFIRIFQWLASNTRLAVVSYNYDILAEDCIIGAGWKYLEAPSKAVDSIRFVRRDEVLLIKPHGSVSHMGPSLMTRGGNPWLSESPHYISYGDPVYRHDYSLQDIPLLPNLVPPGHSKSHILPGVQSPTEAVRAVVAEADMLVVFGLSGRFPDDEELGEYFAQLKAGAMVAHIGREASRADPVVKMLRSTRTSYRFFDNTDPWYVNDLHLIRGYLQTHL